MMFFSCLVSAILLVCSSTNTLAITSSSNETDGMALLAFKDSITADPLGALNSWNNSLHFCNWTGVTCSLRNPRNRITVLDLSFQNLEGTLSPYIANLTSLRNIILTQNNFHGAIPQEIGHLVQIEQLDLSLNSFTGDIPTNLSLCTNLVTINITENKLSGMIPVELTSLSKLRVLNLGKNELQGSIPSHLGNLSSLTNLDLGDGNLIGNIPDDLCRIKSLVVFQLHSNQLTGTVPSCFFNLSSMKIFSLANNQVGGILPVDIGHTLPNLRNLFLGMNRFSGPVPLSLTNASKLDMIALEYNQFTGQIPRDLGRLQGLRILSLHSNLLGSKTGDDLNFVTSLANCTLLQQLFVSNNSLQGLMPDSIANLSTQIMQLHFGENQIYGSIPSGIGNLVSVSILNFQVNNLTGNIPTVIGIFPKLRKLYLNGNQFSGRIPDSIGNLSTLSDLDLSRNKLLGRIPASLGNCQNLFAMDLSQNLLNGTIPKEVIGLTSFRFMLNLYSNELSGSLPPEVGNMTDLVWFDISGNRLSGPIPNTLGNCLSLKYLNMEGNQFESDIPESLRALKGLEFLDLSINNLSGEIPKYLGEFTSLTNLNLSYNELEGPVPKDGVFANVTAITIVGNNKLCGGVPGLKLLPCQIQTFSKKGKLLGPKMVILVILVSLCMVLLLCFFLMLYRRRISKKKLSSPSFSHHPYMRVSYAELLKATNSFSADNLVGVGGYGSVYKGVLDQINNIVAVKVLNLQQRGASKSFLSECNAFRNLRHRNLLNIITACSSVDFEGNDFKALVFEFMPNGNLDEWLHPKVEKEYGLRNLTLLQRLNISIDIASALNYLHNHCQPAILHCDLKPSNVLLDHDMTAHVADFGLAKVFSTTTSSSQIDCSSLAIKGSIGYVPPEYGMGSEVSMQGDVYSYGILMLEMFTAKRPTDSMFENGLSLHNFAKLAFHEQVMNIADPTILLVDHEVIKFEKQSDRGAKIEHCLVSLMRIGVTCSAESPVERMHMGDVVSELCRIKNYHEGVGSI